ncbi:MerR family transcriptional regulator [Aureimonas leprariae]|nr:MerR family transcriptional regulator [Aureimonas leprariae]
MANVEQLLDLNGAEVEPKQVYRIGNLAREFGISLRSLRFYEARGLLHPRRRGTTRLYSPDDRKRLRLILLCKLVGFSLMKIGQIVNDYLGTGSEVKRVRDLREVFRQQQNVLQAQREGLETSIAALEMIISTLEK